MIVPAYTMHYRSFASSARRRKYAFYNLVRDTPTRPQHPIEALLISVRDLKELKKTTKVTYEGAYTVSNMTAEEKIARVFGGRIAGEDRQSLSRISVGQPRNIAGVSVPAKPLEPDNCCMSGCINCVWELYNDDVKDWNAKRREAAAKLAEKGGRWPADFHPPAKWLKPENMPEGTDSAEAATRDESWSNVPVQIRVFAEVEKHLKEKRRLREERVGGAGASP